MKRIFGTKKEKAPTPTIDEASGRLTTRGDTYAQNHYILANIFIVRLVFSLDVSKIAEEAIVR